MKILRKLRDIPMWIVIAAFVVWEVYAHFVAKNTFAHTLSNRLWALQQTKHFGIVWKVVIGGAVSILFSHLLFQTP